MNTSFALVCLFQNDHNFLSSRYKLEKKQTKIYTLLVECKPLQVVQQYQLDESSYIVKKSVKIRNPLTVLVHVTADSVEKVARFTLVLVLSCNLIKEFRRSGCLCKLKKNYQYCNLAERLPSAKDIYQYADMWGVAGIVFQNCNANFNSKLFVMIVAQSNFGIVVIWEIINY